MSGISDCCSGLQSHYMKQPKLECEGVKWFIFTIEEKQDNPILKLESISLEINEISTIARINHLFQKRQIGFITESDSVLHIEINLLRSLQNGGITQITLANNASNENFSIQLDKVNVINSEKYNLLKNYFSNLYQKKLQEESNEKSLNSLKKNVSLSPSTPTNFVKSVKRNKNESILADKSRADKHHSQNNNEKKAQKLNRSFESELTSDPSKEREKKLYQEKSEKIAQVLKSIQRWEEMQRIAQQSVKTFRENHPLIWYQSLLF